MTPRHPTRESVGDGEHNALVGFARALGRLIGAEVYRREAADAGLTHTCKEVPDRADEKN